MTHDPKKAPDPSPTCPRCHYFEQNHADRPGHSARMKATDWPRGIDQHKALDLLTAAFPDSYRGRRDQPR